jgi:hypothetical protein
MERGDFRREQKMRNRGPKSESRKRGKPTRILRFRCSVPGSAFLFLTVASALGAQEIDTEIPAVTPPNFSQVVGRYRISSSAAPTEVRVEEPITLKVQITGQGPAKFYPKRKNLHVFPDDLAADFHVQGVPEEDKLMPERGVWEFVYRLRPKRSDVKVVPNLRLLYFAPGSNKFQSSFADEIPIKVAPPQEATAKNLDLKVVQAPARFYQLRPAEEVIRDDTPLPPAGAGALAGLLALPPAACFLGYRLWRRCHPSASESRRRRRSRAARLALAYLEKRPGDVPRTRAAAVDFLRQRLDLPALEATPNEVARHLKRLGFAKPLVADWAVFLQTCDRFQFAASPEPLEKPLHVEAVRLINAVEADPCVTG